MEKEGKTRKTPETLFLHFPITFSSNNLNVNEKLRNLQIVEKNFVPCENHSRWISNFQCVVKVVMHGKTYIKSDTWTCSAQDRSPLPCMPRLCPTIMTLLESAILSDVKKEVSVARFFIQSFPGRLGFETLKRNRREIIQELLELCHDFAMSLFASNVKEELIGFFNSECEAFMHF